MNRRSFIQKTTISTLGMATAFSVPTYAQNSNLKVGLIGCGWYGMVITRAALKVGGVEIIALSDVDSAHLKTSADELEKLQGTRPEMHSDYEDLLEEKGLQAVLIATPPQWHALQFISACKKGLDIYCEKPLAYDVREGQAMVRAAREAGNMVQIGFQRRQSNAFKKAREIIEEGRVGTIHQIGAQIHYNPVLADHTIQDPPESLDWETWCGPAPKLDYRPSIGHMAWRLEKETRRAASAHPSRPGSACAVPRRAGASAGGSDRPRLSSRRSDRAADGTRRTAAQASLRPGSAPARSGNSRTKTSLGELLKGSAHYRRSGRRFATVVGGPAVQPVE